MSDFQRCIEQILIEEGGLSLHPADPGGLTNYGISQRAYPKLDVAALSREDAKGIYYVDYWQPIHGNQLAAGLDLMLLDCAINQGTSTAIKLLQRALLTHEDGLIGPVTLAAATRKMPELLDSLATERALRYAGHPNEATFGRGWYRRLFRIHRQAWAMLEMQP